MDHRPSMRSLSKAKDSSELPHHTSSIHSDPFDAEKIRIRTVPITAQQIVDRIDYGEINLAPDFQRSSQAWNVEMQSRFIESLLLNIPIPLFYVAADRKDHWDVVDGVQRMSAIHRYTKNEFGLIKLEYMDNVHNLRFNDLSRTFQRRINESAFTVNVIDHETPYDVRLNIFARINTGGVKLTSQEIRHALNRGPARDFLKQLARCDEFVAATGGTVESTRMKDREFVLRFMAFRNSAWKYYSARNLDGFLSKTMAQINQWPESQRLTYSQEFKQSMILCNEIFEGEAFRKPSDGQGRKNPISKALFDVWSVNLVINKESDQQTLRTHKREINSEFQNKLQYDDLFSKSITSSTASPRSVRIRFEVVQDIVQGVLG